MFDANCSAADVIMVCPTQFLAAQSTLIGSIDEAEARSH